MGIRKMMLTVLTAGLVAAPSAVSAKPECKTVNGHISSAVVLTLPNGDPCPSPLGICTVGKFIGGLQGEFVFVAEELVPNPDFGVTNVQFTTGLIELETDDGTLTLKDASAFSFDVDGLFGSVHTIVDGSGGLDGASGRLRAYGVFMDGCVSCDYRGEICTR